MDGIQWIADNWPVFLNAVGVIGGLLFNGFALRSDTRSRRITNLLELTQSHRQIWMELQRNPRLSRVLSPTIDTSKEPATREEEAFVGFVVLHLGSTFYALRDRLVLKPDGLRQDIRRFFSLPIPRAIWDNLKAFQNEEFVRFVEKCLK